MTGFGVGKSVLALHQHYRLDFAVGPVPRFELPNPLPIYTARMRKSAQNVSLDPIRVVKYKFPISIYEIFIYAHFA